MKLAIATTLSILVAAAGGAVNAQAQDGDATVIVTRATASVYPELPPGPALPRIQRACTQLEMGARIPADECGQHPLSYVAAEYIAVTSE